jgi:hypothetical protein
MLRFLCRFVFEFNQEKPMRFQRKLIVIALASALPMASAFAQSAADLKTEIEMLKAQLMKLQKQVEAISEKTESIPTSQQVTRLEQKLELAEDTAEKSGFKGLTVKGVIEAAVLTDSLGFGDRFMARSGNGGNTMIEFTKEADGGEGVNWTLRLEPSNNGANLVQEATVSAPLMPGTRVYGGIIPDFQGYEYYWAHLNPLISHNALFDLAGPTTYEGLGMTHALTKEVALKWMIGNIDGGNDDALGLKRTAGLAYRFDWTISEYATLGFSGAHSGSNRKFNIIAIDGGYLRGDWMFNGHLNVGDLDGGAYNGGSAKWTGVSGLVGYKVTPRLNLIARADFINNRDNGGGTYVNNYLGNALGTADTVSGLGPELDDTGAVIDPNVGANLTRFSLGTNYLVNPTTQWKTEIRMDQSSGNNFLNADGQYKKDKLTFGTSLVVAF